MATTEHPPSIHIDLDKTGGIDGLADKFTDVVRDGLRASGVEVEDLRHDQLPLFEGHRVAMAQITFSGGLDLPLSDSDNVDLMQSLTLGKTLTVTFEVDGRRVQMFARVKARAHTRKEGVTSVTKIEVDGPTLTEEGEA